MCVCEKESVCSFPTAIIALIGSLACYTVSARQRKVCVLPLHVLMVTFPWLVLLTTLDRCFLTSDTVTRSMQYSNIYAACRKNIKATIEWMDLLEKSNFSSVCITQIPQRCSKYSAFIHRNANCAKNMIVKNKTCD